MDRETLLLEQTAQGDQQAFSELYDLYQALLYRLVYSILKEEERAKDLTQEVFVQIWEKSKDFDRDKGTPYSWIVTLTRNRAIDVIRSRRYKDHKNTVRDTEDILIPFLASDNPNPLNAVESNERSVIIKKCLSMIPEEQKEMLVTAYFGGYSQTEIAEMYNLPLGTVKTRMRQGLIKLQNLLSGQREAI